MHLEVRQLEVLLAIERAGSLSRAAADLGTDQPHVSRTVRKIEAQLGFPVFERGPGGTRPTASGTEVLDRARVALHALERLQRPAVVDRGLRVLCHEVPAAALTRLLRSGGDLDLGVNSTAPEPAYRELAAGTADVVVAARLPHVRWARPDSVTEVEVGTVRSAVFLPVTHRLTASPEIDLADLAAEHWIAFDDPHAEHALVEECRIVGGFTPRIRYRVRTFDGAYSYLRHGLAVRLGVPSPDRRGFVTRPYRGGGATSVLVAFPGTATGRARAAPALAAARALTDDVFRHGLRTEDGVDGP